MLCWWKGPHLSDISAATGTLGAWVRWHCPSGKEPKVPEGTVNPQTKVGDSQRRKELPRRHSEAEPRFARGSRGVQEPSERVPRS